MAVWVCAKRRTSSETRLEERSTLQNMHRSRSTKWAFSGKNVTEWKLDYHKRHIQQKSHLKAVGIVQRLKMGQGIATLLRESAKGREQRNKLSQKTKSDPKQVKILIDNILLPIKMNASMLSVQQIHNHKVCEYTRKLAKQNYAFWICEINQWECLKCTLAYTDSRWEHRHISSLHKMIVIYIKYREENDVDYKTVFGGII